MSTKKYSIFLSPPPNLTGKLHVGHILNLSIQNFLIKFKSIFLNEKSEMIFGFDHSGLYSEIIARKSITDINNATKENILYKINKNNEYFRQKITYQVKSFNFDINKDILLYTFDEDAKKSVQESLILLQNYIFKSFRIVFYDESLKTVISDIETTSIECTKKLWYIKYYSCDDYSKYITVATTLLETIEADICLVFHPDDNRYQSFINSNVINPITGKSIPIFQSTYINKEFGTGVVKVTPNFSSKDVIIYKDLLNRGIKIDNSKVTIDIKDGVMNKYSRFYNRKFSTITKDIINILTDNNNIENCIEYKTTKYISERSGCNLIEVISEQFFLDLPNLIKNSKFLFSDLKFLGCSGINEINLFTKTLKEWCITRQNIYGHTMPNTTYILDTWYSSAIFPIFFNKKYDQENIKEIIIVTGYDIIFFWVFRMFYLSSNIINRMPFHKVIVHGIICDKYGQKISKSKNNMTSIDFIDELEREKFKMFLLSLNVFNKRIKLDQSQNVEISKTITKLTNIIKFIILQNFEWDNNKDFIQDFTESFLYYNFIEVSETERILNISKLPFYIRSIIGNIYITNIKKSNYFDLYMSNLCKSIYLILLLIKCIMPSYSNDQINILTSFLTKKISLFNLEYLNINNIKDINISKYNFKIIEEALVSKKYTIIGNIFLNNLEYDKIILNLDRYNIKIYQK